MPKLAPPPRLLQAIYTDCYKDLVYFVDNVITTGTTIATCRCAVGFGTGLAYADASTAHNNRRF